MKSKSITGTDFAVIAVIWGLDIFDSWTDTWGNLTLSNIFRDMVNSTGYVISSYVLLFVKCATCLSASFIADLKNRKFQTYFLSLVVFSLTPFFGICAIISEYAALGFIIPWFVAAAFVTTPLRFCIIFNQKPNATADQTRLVVAFFEFLVSFSSYLLTTFKEELANFPVLYLIVIWTVKIPLFVLVITLTDSVKKYVSKEIVTERTVKATFEGIRQDVRSEKKKMLIGQFLLFAVLLSPILIITFIDGVLGTVDFDSTRHIVRKTLFKKYEYLAQLVGLPLLCLLLSIGRGIIGRFGDLLVIGIAHAFNTMICVLLYFYLRDKAIADALAADMMRGTPSGPGHATMLLINGTENQYYVRTPFFTSAHPVGVLYLDVVLTKSSRSFDLEEEQPGYPPLTTPVTIKREERRRFLTIGTDKKNTKVITVSGDDDYKVREGETVVMIMNGIVGESINGVNIPGESKDHIIQIEQSGRLLHNIPLPPSTNMLKLHVPTGDTVFSYYCKTENSTGFGPVKARVMMEPFTEITCVITNNGRTSMRFYSTLFVPPDSRVTAEKFFSSTYSLAGLAQSATSLGYTQFFWTESPIRLRTTVYAVFIVSNELIRYFTRHLLPSVTTTISLCCIALSSLGLIVHLGFGIWYDLNFRRESWLHPNESTANVNAPELQEHSKSSKVLDSF